MAIYSWNGMAARGMLLAALLPASAQGVAQQAAPATPAPAAATQKKPDLVRALADRMAAEIVRKNGAAIYENMSPKLKKAYTRDQLIAPVAGMQAVYGDIQSYAYKSTTLGKRGVNGEWIRTLQFWYAVVTSTNPSKVHLRVEITRENERYYLAGYALEKSLIGVAPHLR